MLKSSASPFRIYGSLAAGLVFCGALLGFALYHPLRVRQAVSQFDARPSEATEWIQADYAEQAVPTLIQKALSPECLHRKEVVELLVRLDAKEAYFAFTQTARDYGSPQQIPAIAALGFLEDPGARHLLQLLAESEEENIRQAARRAMES
jgi:hypothetical protein